MRNRLIDSRFVKVVILLLTFSVLSCSDLLDSENINSLSEDDLLNPKAQRPMANGLQASVTRAMANILTPYSVTSDELVWSGSRDAWQQLNFGQVSDPENEFTDAAYRYTAEARWWADDVIKRLEAFKADGLGDSQSLARAYLYGATIYITVADMYENFTFSDKATPGPAVGADNMIGLYDVAIEYLNGALAENQSSMEGQIRGMLARAHWSKVAWDKARARSGGIAALVNDASANAAASAALDLNVGATTDNVFYQLDVDGTTPDVIGDGSLPIGNEVNSRKEQRISDLYVITDPETGNTVADINSGDPAKSIKLMDPIDNIPDPVLYKAVFDFVDAVNEVDHTITSQREMYLILAESALAASNMGDFATNINALRALDNLTPWVDEVTSGISAFDLLLHERRVNFFLQGRRLTDHYRFDDPSPFWISGSNAMTEPTFFPVGITEDRANTEFSN